MAISYKPSFYDYLLREIQFIEDRMTRVIFNAYLSAMHMAWTNQLEINELTDKLENK